MKSGDKVKVKSREELERLNCSPITFSITNEMFEYADKVVTIDKMYYDYCTIKELTEFEEGPFWDYNCFEKADQSFFDEAYASLARMQNEKDKRYGQAALEPLTIFTGKTKVADRIHDKLKRIENSDVLRKNDVADLIGYLMLVCKENNWNNFEDLID